jgi:hypothetical protein
MAISEDVLEEDVEAPLVSMSPEPTDITPPSDPLEVEPIISLNDLTGFSAPQTLKLIGYIKHRKVIILVDSGMIQNWILGPKWVPKGLKIKVIRMASKWTCA